MGHRFWVGVALALCACTYTSEKFEDDFGEAYCEFVMGCTPPFEDDLAECLQGVAEDRPDASCVFDEVLAKTCRDELRARTCAGTGTNFPTECDRVYDCDAVEGDTD